MTVVEHVELAYVGVEVADVGALDRYLGETVGLMEAGPSAGGESRWRVDDRAYRLVATEGPADDVAYVGFQYRTEADLHRGVDRLLATGRAVVPGGAALAERREVDEVFTVTSPWGVPVELVRGLAAADTPFTSPHHPSGFVTGDHGMGHVVFLVAPEQREESGRFLVSGLGLRLTDYLQRPGSPFRGDFYHGNGRHHTVALIGVPVPGGRLNHIMVETADRDAVGLAFDRAVVGGLPIPRGLGRHDNDQMFSFYGTTPAGFDIEVGYGGRTVEDPCEPRRYERASQWGHQPFVAAPPASGSAPPAQRKDGR